MNQLLKQNLRINSSNYNKNIMKIWIKNLKPQRIRTMIKNRINNNDDSKKKFGKIFILIMYF